MDTKRALVVLTLFSLAAAARATDFHASGPAVSAALKGAAALSRELETRPAPSVIGQFDYYVLALSWEPAFCETKPEAMECQTLTKERYDATHLVLHGLWPNKNGDKTYSYGYCAVPKEWQKLDKPATWCRMPPLELSDATEMELTTTMPGWGSFLERHEWYKHGICSGLTPEQYYTASSALVVKFGETGFGRYLAAHVGETVASEALFAAFELDFGAGSRAALKLFCSNIKGQPTLSEIFVTLKAPLPAGELKDMVAPAENPGRGSCPAAVYIDPAL